MSRMLTSNNENLNLNLYNFYPNTTQKQVNSMNFVSTERKTPDFLLLLF